MRIALLALYCVVVCAVSCPPAGLPNQSEISINPLTGAEVCSECTPGGSSCPPDKACTFIQSTTMHQCVSVSPQDITCSIRDWDVAATAECPESFRCLAHKCRQCWDYESHPQYTEYYCRNGVWKRTGTFENLTDPLYASIFAFVGVVVVGGVLICLGQSLIFAVDVIGLKYFKVSLEERKSKARLSRFKKDL